MKNLYTSLLFIIILLYSSTTLLSQHNAFFDTQGFSFQGYARNPSGGALASQSIDIKFTIYPSGNESGAVFTETHTNVQTDPFGVFGVVVGSVSTATFRNINFGKENYWLKVETKPSTSGSFAEINNSALLSTAYAKFANNGNPPGTIITFAGPKTNIPPGYLICDGTEHNISNYPNLAVAIGSSWGGNGSSTFRVPDLRGMFLRGFSDAADDDPNKTTRTARQGGAIGNAVGSYQGNEMQSHNHGPGTLGGGTNTTGEHTHLYTFRIHGVSGNGGTGSDWAFTQDANTSAAGNHSHTVSINSGSTANHGGSETRPKNVYVLYLIKY